MCQFRPHAWHGKMGLLSAAGPSHLWHSTTLPSASTRRYRSGSSGSSCFRFLQTKGQPIHQMAQKRKSKAYLVLAASFAAASFSSYSPSVPVLTLSNRSRTSIGSRKALAFLRSRLSSARANGPWCSSLSAAFFRHWQRLQYHSWDEDSWSSPRGGSRHLK
jgi:hypothetical protein